MLVEDDFNDLELRLQTAMLNGTGVRIDPPAEHTEDDKGPQATSSDKEPTVRAEVLAALLTTPSPHQPRAVRLAGARITGRLDLSNAELLYCLELRACRFDEPLILTAARAPAIHLPDCHLPALRARQLTTCGDLNLEGITTSQVTLVSAHIGGMLSLHKAVVRNPGGWALDAHSVVIGQSMGCTGLTIEGETHLNLARIDGSLFLDGATLDNRGDWALDARQINVRRAMFLRQGFTAYGGLRSTAPASVGASSFGERPWPTQPRMTSRCLLLGSQSAAG